MTNEKTTWMVGLGALLAGLSGCAVEPAGGKGNGSDMNGVDTPQTDGDDGDDGGDGDGDDGDGAPDVDGGGADPESDAGTMVEPETDAGGEEPLPVIMDAWPGGTPSTADRAYTFGGNMSGLTWQAAAPGVPETLWAVQNNPAKLFRLEREEDGDWEPAGSGFRDGKQLLFTDGQGEPDAEGVTFADGAAVYVASERDGRQDEVSRSSILRYELTDSDALTATHEWQLAGDLPEVDDANQGIESVTWVPDAHLTSLHFRDDKTGDVYDPAEYRDHGTGLFFVGLEANGLIYAFALNHYNSSADLVATIDSGNPQVMGLEFDRVQGTLWTHCDDGCGNKTSVLAITPQVGRFELRALFDPPAALAELNDEGIAFSDCQGDERTFFWADDNETDGHAIRTSVTPCVPFDL